MKKFLVFFIFIGFVFATQPRKYNNEAIKISDEINKILINNKYCETKYTQGGYKTNTCTSKKIFFTTGTNERIVAEFYQVTNPKTIKQIESIYTNFYYKNNKSIGIYIKFYRGTHKDEAELFFGLFGKPFKKFILKEK